MQGPKTSVILHQVCNSTAIAAAAKPGNISLPSDCILPRGACHQQLVLDVMTDLSWKTRIRYASGHTASTSQCLAICIDTLNEAGLRAGTCRRLYSSAVVGVAGTFTAPQLALFQRCVPGGIKLQEPDKKVRSTYCMISQSVG